MGYSWPQYDVKTKPISTTPVLGRTVKHGGSVLGLFLMINLLTAILMKSSRREHYLESIIHSDILKNNQLTFFLCFTFTLKTDVSFYCAQSISLDSRKGVCCCYSLLDIWHFLNCKFAFCELNRIRCRLLSSSRDRASSVFFFLPKSSFSIQGKGEAPGED